MNNLKDIEILVLEDLRMDDTEFETFDLDLVKQISDAYHSTNVTLFYKYLKRKRKH